MGSGSLPSRPCSSGPHTHTHTSHRQKTGPRCILLLLPPLAGLPGLVLGRPGSPPPRPPATFSMQPPGTLLFLAPGRFVGSLCPSALPQPSLPHASRCPSSAPLLTCLPPPPLYQPPTLRSRAKVLQTRAPGPSRPQLARPPLPSPPPGCGSPPLPATAAESQKPKPRPAGQAPPPARAGPAPRSPEAAPRARGLVGAGGEGPRASVGRAGGGADGPPTPARRGGDGGHCGGGGGGRAEAGVPALRGGGSISIGGFT